MEVRSPQTIAQFRCAPTTRKNYISSSIANGQPKRARVKELQGKFSSLAVSRSSRRLFLEFLGFSSAFLPVCPAPAAEMLDMKEVEVIRTLKLASGVRVQDQFSGESNPVTLPLDNKQIIEGLKEVLIGMRVGGKRRALIPPTVGYINENLKPIPDEFGPRRSLLSHANEPLVFEVQLLKVL
ncbi:PREDICTED: peptidyl-prolyl cis-trans isomerase FKBP16-1, chloroplastic isoform X3 [Nelumbo nucifera]|uniref:peptidylprolyl isomerase n=1 Tax=Nelumbo nucifera TaxID=4432 RepID=A0A1U7ZMA0_NELNU|nr:PREDICTED: peptidyl-prolyl cis-trans isomerase FKBP16-1, chloroplastic isoform X3 [Nelumbo nucifera]